MLIVNDEGVFFLNFFSLTIGPQVAFCRFIAYWPLFKFLFL